MQAFEVWQQHGEWVTTHRPLFGPGIKERLEMAAAVTQEEAAAATQQRARWVGGKAASGSYRDAAVTPDLCLRIYLQDHLMVQQISAQSQLNPSSIPALLLQRGRFRCGQRRGHCPALQWVTAVGHCPALQWVTALQWGSLPCSGGHCPALQWVTALLQCRQRGGSRRGTPETCPVCHVN